MAFTESLTVRILGDSSGLQRELSRVLQSIDSLHQRIEETSRASGQIGSALSRVSQATGPLQQVSGLLARVSQQARSLSQQPVNLNVNPAMSALQKLMQSIAAVSVQIRSLSAASAMSSMPAAPAMMGALAPSTRRMASGGLVSGPSGIDQIPARLTAGEYVLNQHAVQTLGQSFIDQLNRSPESLMRPQPWSSTSSSERQQRSTSNRIPQAAESVSQTTSNHFGGITVMVNQAGEVSEVVQRIEQQQRALRNRRG